MILNSISAPGADFGPKGRSARKIGREYQKIRDSMIESISEHAPGKHLLLLKTKTNSQKSDRKFGPDKISKTTVHDPDKGF